MKKKSTEIVDLLKRYFDAQIIGSHLFVQAGLLSIDDTNDIDVFVHTGVEKLEKFLKDQGFTGELIQKQPDIYSEKVAVRTKFSNPEYDKIIDVNYVSKSINVYTIGELIRAKFESARSEDLKQLSMVLFNKAGSSSLSQKQLQDFYKENYKSNETI